MSRKRAHRMTTSVQQPAFSEKRKLWLEALNGTDGNSIVSQIFQMTWDDASFRVINEARRLAPVDPDGSVQLNGLVLRLLNRGFLAIQASAIRRLADKACHRSNPLEGKEGVRSLIALIGDMRKHRSLLTRRAMFDAEGRAYDNERCHEHGMADAEGRAYHNERRHEHIDRLAGVKPENRQPEDTIREDVFDNLRIKIDKATETISEYATKFLAHAATSDSRAYVNADDIEITLGCLREAQRSLSEVTGFLAVEILGDSCSTNFLPKPVCAHLEYIEMPLTAPENKQKLLEVWRQCERKSGQWSGWRLDEYEKEFSDAPPAAGNQESGVPDM